MYEVILLGLTIIIIAMLLLFYPVVMRKTQQTVVFRIPRGATAAMVSDSLTKHYGPGMAKSVMRLMNMRRVDYSKRHGMYEVPQGSNAIAVARKIGAGGQTPVRLTVNGFRSLDLLASRISAKLEFPADSLLLLLNDREVMSRYGLRPEQALALFVDDTYEVYWTSSPREVIDKIGKNYLSLWNQERRDKAAALGLSPAEVMTVASIADEETNDPDEKGKVARLYINRLKKGMRLQADPTIRFALNDFTIRRVKGNHLKVNSPYNTYTHNGLPPGPIRTTGRSTVDRLLDSEPHDYLFMCAKEDFSGSHNFASTFAEHSRNAERYRHALNARGIQ